MDHEIDDGKEVGRNMVAVITAALGAEPEIVRAVVNEFDEEMCRRMVVGLAHLQAEMLRLHSHDPFAELQDIARSIELGEDHT